MKVPVEVSARHVHLSQKDFEKLFGKSAKLIPIKKLSQPGEFASKETITIISGKNKIENVRVLGPTRKNSQLEISRTDAFKLKINPPLRISGNIKGAPKIKAKGKKGTAEIPTIIAKRHLHISSQQAKKFKLKNKQIIKIKIKGKRALIFDEVVVRNKGYLSFQIDTDEANAAGINKKSFGEIIK